MFKSLAFSTVSLLSLSAGLFVLGSPVVTSTASAQIPPAGAGLCEKSTDEFGVVCTKITCKDPCDVAINGSCPCNDDTGT